MPSPRSRSSVKDWESKGEVQWDDYGFKFKSDQQIYWLSGARASGEFTIDVTRDAASGKIDATKLLGQVMKIKAELLKLMS